MMARVCFSSAPPAVGFGNKGLRGALTLEIARTFDLFRETTLFFFFSPGETGRSFKSARPWAPVQRVQAHVGAWQACACA